MLFQSFRIKVPSISEVFVWSGQGAGTLAQSQPFGAVHRQTERCSVLFGFSLVSYFLFLCSAIYQRYQRTSIGHPD